MARLAVIALAFINFAIPVRASDPPPFQQYLEGELNSIDDTLDQQSDRDGRDSSLFFRRFWLRIRPNITFTAGIAKIAIVPELELLWQRDLPDGWIPYQPKLP